MREALEIKKAKYNKKTKVLNREEGNLDDDWRAWEKQEPCLRGLFAQFYCSLFTVMLHTFVLEFGTLRFTASGVKFMDFYGDFYCFLIYISRLLVVIFETWLYSLPYFYDITSIVSSSDSCGSCYSHSLQSSSRRLRLTF